MQQSRFARFAGLLSAGLFVAACGGALASPDPGAQGSSSGNTPSASASTTSSPPSKLPPSPPTSGSGTSKPPPPPPPAPQQSCVDFDVSELVQGDTWAISERVLGDGFVRFQAQDPKLVLEGSMGYVPPASQPGGLFDCSSTTAEYVLDAKQRRIEVNFPNPCHSYTLEFDSTMCKDPKSGDLWTEVFVTDKANGRFSPDGIIVRANGRCNAAFTSCK